MTDLRLPVMVNTKPSAASEEAWQGIPIVPPYLEAAQLSGLVLEKLSVREPVRVAWSCADVFQNVFMWKNQQPVGSLII